jgi:hypothetical protein
VVAADSGSRSFTVSVCFVLVLVFRFLIFSLSGFPALFHRKSCHVSPFPPFAFCYPFLRCSSLRYRPSVFRSLFYALLFFYIIMYAHARIRTEKRKGPIRKQQTENKKRRKNGRQTCKLAKLAASPHTHVRVHYNIKK